MSLHGQRLVATLAAFWVVALAASAVYADALPDSTWAGLKALPHQGRSAVFALAVDPSNNQVLIAGNSAGSLLRSTDGAASWTSVHSGKAVLTTIEFSPFTAGLVLAGTHGSGALVSQDGGVTWAAATGLEGRAVRVFAFALTLSAAGTDRGVFTSQDGLSWTASGLANHSVNTLAVEAIHTPVRLVAGSDSATTGAPLPLYQSIDAGATWTTFNPPISGTFAVRLTAGPLPPVGGIRPLVVGTNAGLFESMDNGATFVPLSGGVLLPSTDYTQVFFVTDHANRFYAASDGGGSGSGGLWRTTDGGQTFLSLAPPVLSITALAVSNDESPTLYVGTFDPTSHAAALWAYHDTGGLPLGPAVSPSPFVSGGRLSSPRPGSSIFDVLRTSQAPYVALGIGALLLILAALVSNARGRRR
ncbi:MAG: WD40/YVTN/BNR-like repeat-containing protein [Candidatus Dormibacteraceae bacterium]